MLHEGKQVTLHLRAVDEVDWMVDMKGVEALRVDGFAEGNIVLDMVVFDGDAPDVSRIASLLQADVESEAVCRRIRELKNGQIRYLELAPSYGAEVSSLFHEIRVARVA